MIKLEKCSIIILTVFVRTSIKSHLSYLFVCGIDLTECNSVPIKPCKYEVWMLEQLAM